MKPPLQMMQCQNCPAVFMARPSKRRKFCAVCGANGRRMRLRSRPHPLKQAMDEIAMRARFGLLFDEIFGGESG